MPTVKYLVPNISCHHCVMTIERELRALDGVLDVYAEVPGKTVEVTFEAPATEEQIRQRLAEIHYPAAQRLN